MGIKLANNAVSRLSANITNSSTTINLIPGDGALFPLLGADEWHPATIIDMTGAIEIVRVTARSTDALTVVRAQEGTSARSFSANDRIEVRLTAGAVDSIQTAAQAGVSALQGDVTTLQSSVAAVQGDVSTLQTDVNALESTVTSLDASTDASVANLQAQINAIPPAEGLPVGFGPVPWSLLTEPTGWIFADGRTLTSGTTYTALRTAYINASFPFGQDGSGNPKIPDMRGRVPAGKDNMGGTAASRLTSALSGIDGVTLGSAGGAQVHTLLEAQIPSHSHSGSTSSAGEHAHSYTGPTGSWNLGVGDNSYNVMPGGDTTGSAGSHTHSVSIGNTGGGGAHNNTQPTIVTNYIIKV